MFLLAWKHVLHLCVYVSLYICLYHLYAAAAESLQLCPTLCDPTDGSPPGSPVPGILQARTLEWVAISFSNALKWKVKVKSLSCVQLLGIPWTAAYQAPPSMGFSRQEYWSGVPLPSSFPLIGCFWCFDKEFFVSLVDSELATIKEMLLCVYIKMRSQVQVENTLVAFYSSN